MTAFTKENTYVSGSGEELWLHYTGNGKHEFLGRFKYSNPARNAAHFRSFLIKNVTVEHFFAEHAKGVSPSSILEGLGYIGINHTKAMQRLGVTNFADLGAALTAEYYRLKEERENPKPIMLIDIAA